MKIFLGKRNSVVLAYLLAGAVGIISSTQTWVVVVLANTETRVDVPGADALVLLAPLSLAVLALGAAMTMANLVARYILGVLGIAVGVLLATMTAQLIWFMPIGVLSQTLTSVTGLAGESALAQLVGSTSISIWPYLAVIAWAILIYAAVSALLRARGWKRQGKRFDTALAAADSESESLDPVDSWDELSRGSDPTGKRR